MLLHNGMGRHSHGAVKDLGRPDP